MFFYAILRHVWTDNQAVYLQLRFLYIDSLTNYSRISEFQQVLQCSHAKKVLVITGVVLVSWVLNVRACISLIQREDAALESNQPQNVFIDGRTEACEMPTRILD